MIATTTKTKRGMTYITSWEINVFLCLVTWGLPGDVVSRMMKMTKKTHDEKSLEEAMTYWVSNFPSMVRVKGKLKFIQGWEVRNEWEVQYRENAWKNRRNLTIEFKKEWRLRSIEERKQKVVDWCKVGEEEEQLRHQYRLKIRNPSPSYSNEYTNNLWSCWEAGAPSYYYVHPKRRAYVSQWYEGIHPGRFFLFYKENWIIQERNRGVPKGPCEDGYRYPQTPIFDKGPYEQLIEDLRCIDGPGLGETGTKIEHIDDLFI
jgi:hypothetical protein